MSKPNIKQFDAFISIAEGRLGKSLKGTPGGDSKNHKAGALDFGTNSNKLTHKEYLVLGLTAAEHGFRIGDERKTNHLHVDKTSHEDGTLKDNFNRIAEGKEGTVSDKDGVFNRMQEEISKGMTFDDAIEWGTLNDFNIQEDKFKEEVSRTPSATDISQHVLKSPLDEGTLDDLFVDALGLKLSGNRSNPQSIEETLVAARPESIDKSSPESALLESQSNINKFIDPTRSTTKYPIRKDNTIDLGGSTNYGGQPLSSSIIDGMSAWGSRMAQHSQGKVDTTGMGTNLGNQFIEENVVGLVGQMIYKDGITTNLVDPNFDPEDNPEQLTKTLEGLSDAQVKSLLIDYSNNEGDMLAVSQAMKDQNARKLEIQEYSKEHPVLSGTNFAANLLSEAIMFSPVNRIIAAGGLAAAGKGTYKSISAMNKTLALVGAEVVEGGIGEIVRTTQIEDYEFNPYLFSAGVILGAGVNKVMDDAALRKGLTEILDNEGGFIRMSNKQSKLIVTEVAKQTDNLKASKMVNRLLELKTEAAQGVRKSLRLDHDVLVNLISKSKKAFKEAPKGSKAAKIAKSEMQSYRRELTQLKKSMPKQFQQLADGTHPGLELAVNPKMSIKAIAEEFEVPMNVLDNPTKLRDFLGINGTRIGDDVIVEGEKSYTKVLQKQVDELRTNKRLNVNTFLTSVSDKMKTSPLDIDGAISGMLEGMADTSSLTSKYVLNKGNYVSSENPLVGGFYNLIGSDGAGRQGMSQIRAGQSQQKYAKMFGHSIMDNYRTQGDRLIKHLHSKNDRGMVSTIENTVDSEYYENIIEPIFNDRLIMGRAEFARKYSDDLKTIEIAEDFAKDWNKLNVEVNDLLKRYEVEGVIAESSEDFVHASWSNSKTRGIDTPVLEQSIYQGMLKKMKAANIDIDEDELLSLAKKFTYGIQNSDITKGFDAGDAYIDSLNKLLKKTDDATSKITLKDEIRRAQTNKAANKAGDLGNRAMIDLDIEIPNTGMKLSDLMEDNMIVTQKKYNQRMSARIAAAEHGIKDISQLDEWVQDAVDEEIKRLTKQGVEDPTRAVQHLKDSMEQDLKSFKNGNMSGRADLLEEDASSIVRLANKYNFARLMQRVSIASLGELGGTITEVGLYDFAKAYVSALGSHILKLKKTDAVNYADELTEALSSISGVGLEDWVFTSKGVSGGERVFKKGIAGTLEKHVDKMGTVTQGTLGGMETFNRKLTMNAIASKLGKHFSGHDNKTFLPLIFGGGKTTNRTLENLGLGTYDATTKKVITNAKYDLVKSNYLKHAEIDSKGNLLKLNIDKWDKDAARDFGDTILMQSSHIMVDPDSVTSALWQNSTVGKIATQYQTFGRNAKTKVFGYHVNNAAVGLDRGDYAEVIKTANVMFSSSVMGLLALSLNAELGGTGKGNGIGGDAAKYFDHGAAQALTIGLFRSSMNGGMDAVAGTVGSIMFDYDPTSLNPSFTGRSTNIGDLSSTPLGQLVSGGVKIGKNALQGEFQAAGKEALKLSPYQRQLGMAQIINYFSE